MFGQVFDKLGTYFGREFLLSRYVPWLLCIAANLVIACVEFPDVRDLAFKEYIAVSASAASKAIDLAVALIAVWVVSYSTAPLVQVIVNILEGGWLPRWLSWIGYLLVVTHAQRRDALDGQFQTLFARRTELPGLSEVRDRLLDDRAVGARLRTVNDRAAIDVTEREFARLRDRRWLNRTIPLAQFHSAERQLSAALKRNCADADRLLDPAGAGDAARLDHLYMEMRDSLAPYVLDIAEQQEARSKADRQRLFADLELAPTRLGNDAAALRSYCETRYGIEFELFWPRFLLLAQKDAKLGDTIATAKIQLDFSVLSLGLTTITTLAWYVVLAIWGTSLWTASLVFIIGPFATAAWLGIVHASYSSFADLARSAVDLYRFELLSGLHLPLPASTAAEATAWRAVNRLVLLGEKEGNVPFRHPAK
jgi:hypothetical protein